LPSPATHGKGQSIAQLRLYGAALFQVLLLPLLRRAGGGQAGRRPRCRRRRIRRAARAHGAVRHGPTPRRRPDCCRVCRGPIDRLVAPVRLDTGGAMTAPIEPTVSVVIGTYNRGSLIATTLDSV